MKLFVLFRYNNIKTFERNCIMRCLFESNMQIKAIETLFSETNRKEYYNLFLSSKLLKQYSWNKSIFKINRSRYPTCESGLKEY